MVKPTTTAQIFLTKMQQLVLFVMHIVTGRKSTRIQTAVATLMDSFGTATSMKSRFQSTMTAPKSLSKTQRVVLFRRHFVPERGNDSCRLLVQLGWVTLGLLRV